MVHDRGRLAEEKSHSWLDTSRAPLYVLTYPTDRDLEHVVAAHRAVEAIYRSARGPVAWLVDARLVTGATATERQAVASHEARVSELAQRYCVGLALVSPNMLVRGLFTAVTWISPLRYTFQTFGAMDEAERWLRGRLADVR
jgi:hypothetical protein